MRLYKWQNHPLIIFPPTSRHHLARAGGYLFSLNKGLHVVWLLRSTSSTSHTQAHGSIGIAAWDTNREAKSPKIFRACLRARLWWLRQWHNIPETASFGLVTASLQLMLHPNRQGLSVIPKAADHLTGCGLP